MCGALELYPLQFELHANQFQQIHPGHDDVPAQDPRGFFRNAKSLAHQIEHFPGEKKVICPL